MTQVQLSRIESGPPINVIDRLVMWAEALRIPEHCLWFRLPLPALQETGESDSVKRSQFLLLSGAALSGFGASLSGAGPQNSASPETCAQELAWQLWSNGQPRLPRETFSHSIGSGLLELAAAPGSAVVQTADGEFTFVHHSFIDFFVAQRIFADISRGESHLLATAQTSHDTDHIIRSFVARRDEAIATLNQWMKDGGSAVLRVNSAGILAKLKGERVADSVVTRLRVDIDARQLYMTAVVKRVLAVDWNEAVSLSAGFESGAHAIAPERALAYGERFSDELFNPNDGAARWCSIVALGRIHATVPDLTRDAFQRALREENATENLRSIAGVLVGADPITL